MSYYPARFARAPPDRRQWGSRRSRRRRHLAHKLAMGPLVVLLAGNGHAFSVCGIKKPIM